MGGFAYHFAEILMAVALAISLATAWYVYRFVRYQTRLNDFLLGAATRSKNEAANTDSYVLLITDQNAGTFQRIPSLADLAVRKITINQPNDIETVELRPRKSLSPIEKRQYQRQQSLYANLNFTPKTCRQMINLMTQDPAKIGNVKYDFFT